MALAFNPLINNPITKWFLGLFSLDIGIDLGTANTLVNVRNKGIVINEPSWVAVDKKTRRPVAIGAEVEGNCRPDAGQYHRHPPAARRGNIRIRDDRGHAGILYRQGARAEHCAHTEPARGCGRAVGRHRSEKRAVDHATIAAGAREAFLIQEPMAAALGAGLPVAEPLGSMIIDIGGGTTEVAVFSMGGIVLSRSLRVAGDEMDQDIVQYARNKYNLLIGERMAEKVKIAIGYWMWEEKTFTLRGRNLVTGLPEAVEVSSIEVREALSTSVNTIVAAIKDAIDETPPEIIADLMESGVCMAGGGMYSCWDFASDCKMS